MLLVACAWQERVNQRLDNLNQISIPNWKMYSILSNPFWWSGSTEGAISQFSAAVLARVIKNLSIYSTQEGIISGTCSMSPHYSPSHMTGNIYESHTWAVSTANCAGTNTLPFREGVAQPKIFPVSRDLIQNILHLWVCLRSSVPNIALWTKTSSSSWSYFIQILCVFPLVPSICYSGEGAHCFLVTYVVGLHICVIYGFVPLKVCWVSFWSFK